MPTKTKTKSGTIKAKAISVHAHKPNPSKTLMRTSVKKPGKSLKRQVKAVDRLKHKDTLNKAGLSPKATQIRVGKVRVGNVNQSPLVKHFSDARPRTLAMQKPGKVVEPSLGVAAKPYKPKTKPVIISKPKTSGDILEMALNKAVSHRESKVSIKRRGRNKLVWLAVIFVLAGVGLLIAGRLTNARVQVAAHEAGFSANLPNDLPSGYSLDKLTHSNGVVTAGFSDNSEPGLNYSLIQHASLWNNQELKANYVKGVDPNAITMTDNNQTVYLYGDEDATWVNNGIWYVVTSDGALSNQQLLNLAGSS
jgi:hypothetical protein